MPAVDPPSSDSPLDVALAYAACGLRVLPIRPGGKHPPMNSWQHAATVDPKTIRNWWNGLYRNHGVGLAMGPQPDGRWLFTLDVDRHNVDGFDTLYELEQTHGVLPETVCSVTGSGGAHYIFDAGSVQVTNGAAGAVGPGIDIRGAGGQIVVAPSLHPNGQPYGWEDGHAPWETAIAPAPAWLLDLVTPQATTPTEAGVALPNSRPGMPATHDHSPADQLRQDWDWPAELARRGWQHAKGDQWTRPGKNPREGTSGVLHDGGPFVVFTTDTSVEALWRAGKAGNGCVSLSPLAFIAAYDHGGDIAAAGKALRAAEAPVDLSTLIADHPESQPPDAESEGYNPDDELHNMLINWDTFWTRDHNEAEWLAEPVIPAKRSVALFAPGGEGKSLLALWLAAGIAAGTPIFGTTHPPRNVLYLDYEMTEDDLHERLETMGYGPQDNLSHLRYALLPSLPGLDTPEGGKAVVRLAQLCDAELVVIDTFGRAVHGDENESDTVRAWYRWTGLHLKAEHRAFLRVDHAGKDLERGQRGTSAKNDDVDIVWRLTAQDGDMFKLTAKKRRMGWVPESVLLARSEDDTLTYRLVEGAGYPPGTSDVVATLDALELDPMASVRTCAQALKAVGEGKQYKLVQAAVRYRKTRGQTLPPVDKSVDKGRDTPPDTLPQEANATPDGHTTKPLSNTSGHTGTHPPRREWDTVCVSRRGHTRGPGAQPDRTRPPHIPARKDAPHMTAKPVLYVAGPYTRPDPVENTHRAIQVATAIYEDGTYVPVLPHLTLLWHMVTPRPLEFWYEYDLHIMRNCDLVVRLPGPSSGADAEMVEADRVGMTVIEFDSLPDAARQEWTRG